jgi:hypothetical protein
MTYLHGLGCFIFLPDTKVLFVATCIPITLFLDASSSLDFVFMPLYFGILLAFFAKGELIPLLVHGEYEWKRVEEFPIL